MHSFVPSLACILGYVNVIVLPHQRLLLVMSCNELAHIPDPPMVGLSRTSGRSGLTAPSEFISKAALQETLMLWTLIIRDSY